MASARSRDIYASLINQEIQNIIFVEHERLKDAPMNTKRDIENLNIIIEYIRHLEKEIDSLYDTIEDIQHYDCPICKRVKGAGMSECDYCGWNVMR